MNKPEGFPSKKDYFYGVAIACIIISVLIIGLVGSSPTLATKLNFTATVISIILAVIAIIITLVEALNNGHVTETITTSTNTLEKVTVDLKNTTSDLKSTTESSSENIKQANTKINESIEILLTISEIIKDTKIYEEFQQIKDMLKAQGQLLATVEGKMVSGISNSNDSEKTAALADVFRQNKEYVNDFIYSVDIVLNNALFYLIYFLEKISGKISFTSDADYESTYIYKVTLFNRFIIEQILSEVPNKMFLEGILISNYFQLRRIGIINFDSEKVIINNYLLETLASRDINKKIVDDYILELFP